MDFFETVDQRYSYRGEFKDQPIPKEDLEKIMLAGIKAPSGLNKQTTSFIVVLKKDIREKLNNIFPHQGIASAPAVIVALTRKVEIYQGMAFELQDYGAAIENILLAATALGYATVWTDGESATGGRPEAVAELLGVPKGQTVRALLPLGVPIAAGKQASKMKLEERVRFIA